MTAKEVLLRVAESLPDDATILDAINQIELCAAVSEDVSDSDPGPAQLPGEAPTYAPAWLYESPSRLSTILRQSRHRR